MKFLTVMVTAILFAGCTSLEKQQSNERAQVEIVKVQRDAMARDVANQTQAEIAMYESLAEIAATSPESSDAIVLAIAMVANNRSENEGQPGLVTLRENKNDAVELTKALAPTVGGLLTQVGIAALTQQTSREQIRANRDIAVNQANQTANAIANVAALGAAAANNSGDQITMTDQAWLNMGSYEDNDTTSTTTNTSTNTSTNTETNTSDSYNSSSETNTSTNSETNTTDSYNTTDNSVSGNTYDYSQSSVTYGGEEMTLASLIAFLQSTERPYVLTIGDETYTYEGDGESDPVEVDCNQPQFSPSACVTDG